jgi:carbonic anhydrase
MRTHTHETQATVTPARALAFLREGNHRFKSNLRAHRDLLQQVNETRDGQFPFATVLSCIDSRTSAELIFDQGLGDIFSIRVAGNVVNEDILGSMEFACRAAGSRLIVVLGHSSCGAIKGACDHFGRRGVTKEALPANLTTLLAKIQPSVYCERQTVDERVASNPHFVERVAHIQVRRSVEAIVERSNVLRSMIEDGSVGLIGAHYAVESGDVTFFDDTYMCGAIRHFFLDVPEAA